jgi:glycosyltransferase domain-containing protein
MLNQKSEILEMLKKSEDKKITILLHTYNRPEFLKRVLKHIFNNANWNILDLIILDGSSNEVFPKVKIGISDFLENSSVRLVHDPSPDSFLNRLEKGALMARTPFIMLAADDDLYSFNWLEGAIQSLERDSSFGVIYGNILKFKTIGDSVFSPIEESYVAQYKNPALVWLEDETIEERLSSLSNDDFATFGWYSIQRTDMVKKIIFYAKKYKLKDEDGSFEPFFVFAQVALCRIRKIKDITLCRQELTKFKHVPLSYKDNISAFSKLELCLEALLVSECHIEASRARELVKSTFNKQLNVYKMADRKKYIRLLAKRLPIIRRMANFVKSKFKMEKNSIDQRLGARPDNMDIQRNIEMIKTVVSLESGEHLK